LRSIGFPFRLLLPSYWLFEMGKQKWREGLAAGSTSSKRAKGDPESHLMEWLMGQVFWERMTWKQARDCAHASCLDGLTNEPLIELSALGSFGHHEKNASRDSKDLSILQEAIAKSPDPYEFEVSARCKKTLEDLHVRSGCMLLQDYLPCLEKHWNVQFEETLGATSEAVQDFWGKCSLEDPKFHEHPMLQIPSWQTLFLPFFVHSDAAEFCDRDSITVTSFSPVLGRGDSRDLKMLHWAWPKSAETKSLDEGSLEEHWLVTLWDLEACFSGKRPKVDHRGRAFKGNQAWRAKLADKDILANKMRIVLWGILGDLDFFFKDLGTKHWNAAGEGGMCNFCPANTLPLNDPLAIPWTDHRKKALWKFLCYLASQWASIPPSSHPIWQLDGLTRFFLMQDCLHILEQAGVSSHCVGNCLVTILQEIVGKRNAGKDALEKAWTSLWEDICKVYEDLKAQGVIKHELNRLELSWFWHGKDKYPCVSKVVKAAEMRDFVPVLARICEQREGASLEKGQGPYANLPQQRVFLMRNLARFYEICKQEGMFLSPSAAEELQDCAYKVGLFYSKLTLAAQELKLKQFSQVPKFHFMEHLAYQGKFLNPRMFWTYMSEDFVGKIARLGAGLLKATARFNVPLKLTKSYRMAWFFWLRKTFR
jgi:hypothetical protein